MVVTVVIRDNKRVVSGEYAEDGIGVAEVTSTGMLELELSTSVVVETGLLLYPYLLDNGGDCTSKLVPEKYSSSVREMEFSVEVGDFVDNSLEAREVSVNGHQVV